MIPFRPTADAVGRFGVGIGRHSTMRGRLTMTRNPSHAIRPLTAVTTVTTEHATYCTCPACPRVWPHRANDGAPSLIRVRRVQYVRPTDGLTRAAVDGMTAGA